MTLEVTTRDPAADRFSAALSSGLLALLGMVVGIVAAGVIASTGSVVGWLLISGVTLLGLTPALRWLHDRRRTDRVLLWGIEPPRRRNAQRAVDAVNRIEAAQRCLPDGAAADHLTEIYETSRRYLDAMIAASRLPPSAGLRAEIASLSYQLDDLADAADQLARTALPSSSQHLRELSERTRLLSAALEEQDHNTS